MMYVTNQKEIVSHAEYCYREYPTVVNEIPQEKNNYDNTAENFAIIDNRLSASQRQIGESSNLAQICLTYAHSLKENKEKYKEYVAQMAVAAQLCIDSAKKSFDVDITAEIKRIKSEINLAANGYPAFWLVIRRGFSKDKINPKLVCPMNKIYDIKSKRTHYETKTLPMSDYYVKYELDINKRMSRKIENWIEKYSIDVLNYNITDEDLTDEDYLLLRQDFEDLIYDIRRIILPNKYVGLMSWLLNRAFIITPHIEAKQAELQSHIDKNKSLLLKILYTINPECLLKCFAKNVLKNVPQQ